MSHCQMNMKLKRTMAAEPDEDVIDSWEDMAENPVIIFSFNLT